MFYYLLFLHWVGDFLLQTRFIAENKSKHFRIMNIHSNIVASIILLGVVLATPITFETVGNQIRFYLFIYLTHFLQDTFVWRGYKYAMTKILKDKVKDFKYWKSSSFYSVIGFDQMLHVATLYFAWRLFL